MRSMWTSFDRSSAFVAEGSTLTVAGSGRASQAMHRQVDGNFQPAVSSHDPVHVQLWPYSRHLSIHKV